MQRSGSIEYKPLVKYNNIFDGLKKVYVHEGGRTFFKGAGARMAFFAPSTAISIALFEHLKIVYRNLL